MNQPRRWMCRYRAQILNLLQDLQDQFDLTYLFISHDLGVVRYMCDEVALLYLGKIVEVAATEVIFESPKHPYTQALISAIPEPDPDMQREEILLRGELSSAASSSTLRGGTSGDGCPFAPRCHAEKLAKMRDGSSAPARGRARASGRLSFASAADGSGERLMLSKVTLDDIRPIAIGAGILGTGGGGNPYLGGLHLASVIRQKGPQSLVDPFALADDALVCVAGSIGAPTVSIEKLPEGTEMLRALRLLEEHTGRRFDAVAIAEIGGANSMQPLIAGLQAGIPTVDSDSMGRAFPEIQMSSFLFGSEAKVAPYAMVDAADKAAIVPYAASDLWGERIARNIAVSMGARAGLVACMMTGAQLKQSGVHYTLSLAHHLGRASHRSAGAEVRCAAGGGRCAGWAGHLPRQNLRRQPAHHQRLRARLGADRPIQ